MKEIVSDMVASGGICVVRYVEQQAQRLPLSFLGDIWTHSTQFVIETKQDCQVALSESSDSIRIK